jgi:hypothetical protein
MSWVLILWLTGGGSYVGADYRGSITTQEFNNKTGCLTALAFIKKQSEQSVNGVCVPKGKS